jgi:SAM-dependent methyltransferase
MNAASPPSAAFDGLAAAYDQDFTQGLIGRAQRRAVWRVLDRTAAGFGRPLNVLELNCGTGEDALHLAQAGHRVLATDVSETMLAQACAKFARHDLPCRPSTRRLDLCALAAAEAPVAALGGPFDLVLSNFGGLNCVAPSTLQALAAPLAACLAPGGRLFTVVMPRLCLWETVWSLLHGQPRRAVRRWGRGAVVARLGEGQPSLPIWYYAPHDMRRLLGDRFQPVAQHPVGLAVPPSDLEPLAQRWPRLLSVLDALDRLLQSASLGAALADHALIEWRLTPP